ncbi:type II secretion system protein [Coraliomargarita algicola]|uniref:Type II secretion system protein n=2 Tax=Coraliomargaritaceae TaxID=3056371 RepID=A0ABU1AXM9_9BACT|nr:MULTISPECIES: type II secretion system protein [unclassified Coraliomargarita]MDQ8208367.1 type II secretion system protein [Coraliomargarita sp. SDUM461003]WPJ95869.1 type II secretion system protein [Coraliomargarita sp. J2-16]
MHIDRKRGFTLIELLSAIAIAGILLGILIVGIGRVRQTADRVKCVANIRELGKGIMLFSNEHYNRLPPSEEGVSSGTYPGPTFGTDVHSFRSTWSEYIINIYLHEAYDVLICPSRPEEWTAQSRGKYSDYGFNQRLSPVDGEYRKGVPLVTIPNPSNTVLLADSKHSTLNAGMFRLLSYTDVDPRHVGSTANVLYVDQHVESVELNMESPPGYDEPLGRGQFVPEF